MTAVLQGAGGRQISVHGVAFRAGSGLVPHGGGAVAIVIASIVIAVIAAVIALEQNRSARTMFGWMIAAFVVTFVVLTAAVHLFA